MYEKPIDWDSTDTPVQETQMEPVQVEATLGEERLNDPGDALPHYEVGDVFALKGWPFYVQRVNASSLVLKPRLPEGVTSARRFLARMTS